MPMTIMTPNIPSGPVKPKSGGSQIFPTRSSAGPTTPTYTPGPTASNPNNMRGHYGGSVAPGALTKPGFNSSLIDQFGRGIQTQINANTGEYLGQVGIAGQLRDINNQTLKDQAGFDQARLGEQQYRGVDLERERVLNDQASRDKQFGFVREKYNTQLGEVDRQLADLEKQYGADVQFARGVTGKDIENRAGLSQKQYENDKQYLLWQKGNLSTLQGFIDQSYSLGVAGADLGKRVANRDLDSQAAVMGAVGSQGYGLRQGDISEQYNQTLTGLGIQKSKGMNELEQQRQGIDHSLTGRGLDFQDDQRGFQLERDTLKKDVEDAGRGMDSARGKSQYEKDILGIDFRADTATHAASKKDTDIMMKSLDSLGREFGIRKSETQAALKNALRKSNLDYSSTVNQLSSALRSSNRSAQQQALNFMSQLLTMGARR